jgi:hypothetical protein
MKDISDLLKISSADYSSENSLKVGNIAELSNHSSKNSLNDVRNIELTEENFISKDLFRITIHKIKIGNWSEHKSRILSLVPFDSKKKSSRDQSITYTDYFKTEVDEYELEILKLLKPYLSNFRYIDENNETFKIVQYSNVWCQKYLNADWHPPHDHGAMGFSCIFYADYDKTVHQPTGYTCPFPSVSGVKMGMSPNVEEGDLIIFPSFLIHTAPPSGVNKQRIIFSFNVLLNYTDE